jgi:hypothetical protein
MKARNAPGPANLADTLAQCGRAARGKRRGEEGRGMITTQPASTADLQALLGAAQQVGELQGRLRLLADTLTAAGPRDAVTEAADIIDRADEGLTRAFCEHAPQPNAPRKGRAA